MDFPMAEVTALAIPEIIHLKMKPFADSRGYFSEMYNRRALKESGIDIHFVQDNQSFSRLPGTVRGLHYQAEPFAQAKLIRVLRGSILDVVLDVRRSSPSFGKHVAIELRADTFEQLFVPAGFAHGFCTLEPGTEVLYKVSNYYSPQHDFGVLWDDPALGIKWPVAAEVAVVSKRDSEHPRLSDLENYF